jgi:hypothetical protein
LRQKRDNLMLDGTPDSAKQFLLEKLLEQAQEDGIVLSDVERRMFLFSESSDETDWDANQRFEAEYNDTEYETKIAKLLRRSYMHAKRSTDDAAQWRAALQTLRDVDFYGLVMVDRAKIPRPQPHISVIGKEIARGFWSLENPPFLATRVAIVILALFLVLDPLHWGLLRGDAAKLVCIALAAVALWLVSRVEKRALLRKIEEMTDPSLR